MMRRTSKAAGILRTVVIANLLIACNGTAQATGFFVNQQSVRGLGRVDAGNSVAADDASTVFFNPAGLPQLWRNPAARDTDTVYAVGAQLVIPRSDQRNTGSTATTPFTLGMPVPYAGIDSHNPTDATPIPNFYVAHRLSPQGFVGLGVSAPFGLDASFQPNWFGRYDTLEASLRTVNIGLVGAYELSPGFSIGGGLDVQYARSKLSSAIPNPLVLGGPTVATDARIDTSGTAWTPGFNIGVMFQADAATRIGLHYRSAMEHKITGTAVISGLTAPFAANNGAIGATAKLKLPEIATLGIARQVTDKLTLYAELEWYGWSRLNETRIQFADGRPDAVRPANFRDTPAVAIGAEYNVSNDFAVRGGLIYERTPTVDRFRETSFPDADRTSIGLGASVRLSPKVNLDFAYDHVWFRDTNIAITRTFFDGTAAASAVTVNSAVRSSLDTVSVQLRYGF
jgi:long-chain fatty acid transport protein